MYNTTAISDLHGFLPMNLKGGDFLFIGGDVCHHGNEFVQGNWVNFKLSKWMHAQAKKYSHIFMVWGNHDFIGEHPYLLNLNDFPSNFHLLNNQGIEVGGIKVWGTPYSMPFGQWAFMRPDNVLGQMFESIPEGIDVIISHGPPYGYRDAACRMWARSEDDTKWPDPEHTGSKSLTDAILRTNPKLVVCGHIHESYGQKTMPNGSLVVNASRMTLAYRPDNPPVEVFLSV